MSAEPIAGGLINHTFKVYDAAGAPMGALQRLHPVFGAEVNDDIDAVTRRLAASGVATPRLVRTTDGAGFVEVDGGVWRMLTWVDGITVHAITDLDQARDAGRCVAEFHRALEAFDYAFVHVRAGVHDTAAHVAKLRGRVTEHEAGEDWATEASELGGLILAAADALPSIDGLPLHNCHGDLKISNILFASRDPWRARCLIDLDTCARQTMAYELGDAMRSWCNPAGEDVAQPAVDVDILGAAMEGYGRAAPGLLTRPEIDAIVPGIETVCVELAARFCVDVFDDSYFGWNPARFDSRRAHNLMRARGQLALAQSVARRRDALAHIVVHALA